MSPIEAWLALASPALIFGALAGELTQAGVTTVDELDNAETLLAGAA